MATAHYSHEIAGLKTLWIIRFTEAFPHVEDQVRGEPKFELLIPTPFQTDEWLVLDPAHQKKRLQSLERFQALCEEAKQRCVVQAELPGTPQAKVKSAVSEIDNLAKLIEYFHQILKDLKKEKPDN